MDPSEARQLLGIGADATVDDARRAFRRLVLDHHPDRTGGDGAATRALLEAYRTVQAEPDAEPEPDPAPADATVAEGNPLEPLLDGRSLEIHGPADLVFIAILDAAADLGDVTYVDAESGLLEVVVTADDGTRSSLLLTLQGRAALGTTEVFATIEPLG